MGSVSGEVVVLQRKLTHEKEPAKVLSLFLVPRRFLVFYLNNNFTLTDCPRRVVRDQTMLGLLKGLWPWVLSI